MNDAAKPDDRDGADGSSPRDGTDAAFHTDTPTANGAIQRGLGVGAAELAAQREPEGAATSPDDDIPVREPKIDSPEDSNRRP